MKRNFTLASTGAPTPTAYDPRDSSAATTTLAKTRRPTYGEVADVLAMVHERPTYEGSHLTDKPISNFTLSEIFESLDFNQLKTAVTETGLNRPDTWVFQFAPIYVMGDNEPLEEQVLSRTFAGRGWDEVAAGGVGRGITFFDQARRYGMRRFMAAVDGIDHEVMQTDAGRNLMLQMLELRIAGLQQTQLIEGELVVRNATNLYKNPRGEWAHMLPPGLNLKKSQNRTFTSFGMLGRDAAALFKLDAMASEDMGRANITRDIIRLPSGSLACISENAWATTFSRVGDAKEIKSAIKNPKAASRRALGSKVLVDQGSIYFETSCRAFGPSNSDLDFTTRPIEVGRRFLSQANRYANGNPSEYDTSNFNAFQMHDEDADSWQIVRPEALVDHMGIWDDQGDLDVNTLESFAADYLAWMNVNAVKVPTVGGVEGSLFFRPFGRGTNELAPCLTWGDVPLEAYSEKDLQHFMKIFVAKLRASPEGISSANLVDKLLKRSSMLDNTVITEQVEAFYYTISAMPEHRPGIGDSSFKTVGSTGALGYPYLDEHRIMYNRPPLPVDQNGLRNLIGATMYTYHEVFGPQARPDTITTAGDFFVTEQEFLQVKSGKYVQVTPAGKDGYPLETRVYFRAMTAPERQAGYGGLYDLFTQAHMFNIGDTRGWNVQMLGEAAEEVDGFQRAWNFVASIFSERENLAFDPKNAPSYLSADGVLVGPEAIFFHGELLPKQRFPIFGRFSNGGPVNFKDVAGAGQQRTPEEAVDYSAYSRVLGQIFGAGASNTEKRLLAVLAMSPSQSRHAIFSKNVEKLLSGSPIDFFDELATNNNNGRTVMLKFLKANGVVGLTEESTPERIVTATVRTLLSKLHSIVDFAAYTDADINAQIAEKTRIAFTSGFSNFVSMLLDEDSILVDSELIGSGKLDTAREWEDLLRLYAQRSVSASVGGQTSAYQDGAERRLREKINDVVAPNVVANEKFSQETVRWVSLRACPSAERLTEWFSRIPADKSFFIPCSVDSATKPCVNSNNARIDRVTISDHVRKAIASMMNTNYRMDRIRGSGNESASGADMDYLMASMGPLQPQRLDSDSGDLVYKPGRNAFDPNINGFLPAERSVLRMNRVRRIAFAERSGRSRLEIAAGRLLAWTRKTAPGLKRFIQGNVPVPVNLMLMQPFGLMYMGAGTWLASGNARNKVGYEHLGIFLDQTFKWSVQMAAHQGCTIYDEKAVYWMFDIFHHSYEGGLGRKYIRGPRDFSPEKPWEKTSRDTFVFDVGLSFTQDSFGYDCTSLNGRWEDYEIAYTQTLLNEANAIDLTFQNQAFYMWLYQIQRMNDEAGPHQFGERRYEESMQGAGRRNTMCWQGKQRLYDEVQKTFNETNCIRGEGHLGDFILDSMRSVYQQTELMSAKSTGSVIEH